jgi:NAD-dependent SIR2 family protein deacetylase
MSFLEHKKMLGTVFTQNIDCLEFKTGISKEKVVHAHGNVLEAHCSGCGKDQDIKTQNKHIVEGKILYCEDCNSPCKPKVILYGEAMPKHFVDRVSVNISI